MGISPACSGVQCGFPSGPYRHEGLHKIWRKLATDAASLVCWFCHVQHHEFCKRFSKNPSQQCIIYIYTLYRLYTDCIHMNLHHQRICHAKNSPKLLRHAPWSTSLPSWFFGETPQDLSTKKKWSYPTTPKKKICLAAKSHLTLKSGIE